MYFYSKYAGFKITIPQEFEDQTKIKGMAGKVLEFTPIGSAQAGVWGGGQWGMIPAVTPEEQAYFKWRRELQQQNGGTADVYSQEEFNNEMQIEARGARNVATDALASLKQKVSLLDELVKQGVLNADYSPRIESAPDEVKAQLVDAAAQQSLISGTEAAPAAPKGKQRIGM